MSWAEALVKELSKSKPEGSISVNELSKQTGKSRQNCQYILEKKLKSGEVVREKVDGIYYYMEAE